MISKRDHTTELIQGIEEATKSLQNKQAPRWLNALRAQGISRFTDIGIPTVKDEDWKYTNLAPLTGHTFTIAKKGELAEQTPFKNYCDDKETNIVFINGILSLEHSNLKNIPKGITISTLQQAIADGTSSVEKLLTKYDIKSETAFVALNEALSSNGAYIRIGEQTVCKDLIHIIHVTSSDHQETVSMPRTLITVGRSGEATILESHVAFNDRITYFANALTDIFIAENATCHYCKSQKESLSAFHIGHTRIWQERDSNFDGFSLMAGGRLARNDLDVVLNGEGAHAALNALYSVYNDQHVDNHTSVDHRVPNCTSNQFYKGILNNAARAVFNGKVFVRPIAQQTNSYQLNKNLLLGKDCRVDTKPQLEIFADDVKCTHGATIGQLNEDEMFYLQTRCLSRMIATKMLVRGFAEDIFNTIKSDSIRRKLDILMKPSFDTLGN